MRKDTDDPNNLTLNNVTDHRGDKMTLERCILLCNAFKNVEESKNPNVTVTGCQYKRGGLCGYFTEPIHDPGVNARVGVTLTREIPSAASLDDPDQCCAFRQGNININIAENHQIFLKASQKNGTTCHGLFFVKVVSMTIIGMT